MDILGTLFSGLNDNAIEFITIAVVMAGLFVAHWLLLSRPRNPNEERRFSRRHKWSEAILQIMET